MDWVPLNFAIIKNPYNWAIVLLMVIIAGLAINLIFPAPTANEEG